LASLPSEVRSSVAVSFERIRLPNRATIYELGGRVDFLYFPIDAVISVVTVMSDGTQIEVMTVGREGLTGAQVLLDGRTASALTWCQVAGDAYRIDVATFRVLAATQPAVREVVERYLSAQIDAMAQAIACNRLHYVSERCARWLLMTYDRVGRPDFALTHESLATMLGVRRAGVSIAAAALQQAGFIRYVRGKFTIVNAAGLETAACECYTAINSAFSRRRLMPTGTG
jgi:CRP-like cAMP-binding protein